MDPFGTGQVLPPLQVPQPTVQDTIVPPLKKPPKWVRRPVGASFAVSATLKYIYKHVNGKGIYDSESVVVFFFLSSVES